MNNPIDRRRVTAMGIAGSPALLAMPARAEPRSGEADDGTSLREIAEARRHFAEVLFRQDHGALPALFTADTLLLPSGKPLVKGAEAATAFWTAATSDPRKRLRSAFDAIDSLCADGIVVETGRATVYAVETRRELLLDRGKYIVVWKRADGRWLRHRDIFNSDGPLA